LAPGLRCASRLVGFAGRQASRATCPSVTRYVVPASDKAAGEGIATLLGNPPANVAADAGIASPLLKYMAAKVKDPGIPLLDSVLPNSTALYLYKQLQLAFSGKATPQEAMQATQNAFERQAP